MRISDMISRCGPFVSFEFFPPKDKEKWPDFFKVVEELKQARPLFVSVTYGAGGSTQANTLEIVARLRRDLELEPMAHLTCVGASEAAIAGFLDELRRAGVDNVMALRGDPPKGAADFIPDNPKFSHASDLTAFIKERHPDMGVGVAAYPETHPEAASMEEDIRFLKLKLDQGGHFVVTQFFFDNRHYFEFVDKARSMGVDAPIIPGIMPILALGSIKRMLSLSNASMPGDFMRALEEAEAKGGDKAVRELGLAHARDQVLGLIKGGAPGVHLYTLNRADACLSIVRDPAIAGVLGID